MYQLYQPQLTIWQTNMIVDKNTLISIGKSTNQVNIVSSYIPKLPDGKNHHAFSWNPTKSPQQIIHFTDGFSMIFQLSTPSSHKTGLAPGPVSNGKNHQTRPLPRVTVAR